ncbi:hypothetical protein HanXRQr2_Chr13g0576981 [Helianthus annuus]|uniref:Uncharacterized protein n=2 Tax=Helianthus annuus TaxID=4232 RepID=A0A9K3EFZ6_HELAN|nr:hypothetical protein HanXRQr2_Chr13g0576981 [Helianthus annuus]
MVERCFVFKMKMVIKKRNPRKDYNASSGFRGDDGVVVKAIFRRPFLEALQLLI